MKRRHARSLGDVNADARLAIGAARKGKCSVAMRQLYNASPHMQSKSPSEADKESYRLASIIVAKHCAPGVPRKRARSGRIIAQYGFDGSRRKRRR